MMTNSLEAEYYFGIKTVIEDTTTFDNYWRNVNAHYLFNKYYTHFKKVSHKSEHQFYKQFQPP